MILADSSVWIDHLRREIPEMSALLKNKQIVVHSLVLGELACGNIRNRSEFFATLREAKQTTTLTVDEVVTFIDAHKLFGRGLGLTDCHLLAACKLEHHHLWTHDRPLAEAARMLGLLYF